MNFNILLFIFPPNCQARINIDKIKGNKPKYRFLVSTITINAKKKRAVDRKFANFALMT